jgi:hypothetical protein
MKILTSKESFLPLWIHSSKLIVPSLSCYFCQPSRCLFLAYNEISGFALYKTGKVAGLYVRRLEFGQLDRFGSCGYQHSASCNRDSLIP